MVHHHSIRFKMDNKKHIVNLKYFREMLHICSRLPGQTFDEAPFEEEILAFLLFLGHNGAIRRLTNVNINKLHQPWISFAAIINKCLSGKSSGYDSLRLSQAQFLWGFYHKRNVDFAYLLWEDFVYHVEHKDTKKSNEMYYPRFTKVIIQYFKVQGSFNTKEKQGELALYIRNSESYKEYYTVATGATPPKTKASVQKTKSSSKTTVTPPPTAAAGTRLFTSAKGKQPATTSKANSLTALLEVAMTEAEQLKLATKRSLQQTHISQASGSGADERTGTILGVTDVPTDESDEEISWKSSDEGEEDDDDDQEDVHKDDDDQEEGDDDDDQEEGSDDEQAFDKEGEEFIHPSLSTHDEEETRDEESFDPILKTPENTNDEGNSEENLRLNVGRKEGQDEEDDADELYRDVNINLEGRRIESIFETTSEMDVQSQTTVAPLPLSEPTLTLSTIATVTTVQQAPTPPKTAPSILLQNLPKFGSLFRFDHRLKTLEDNFSEFVQTNQFAGAVSSIPRIVQRYMDQRKNEAVKVKVQVSKILPKIKQTVNEQLEAEVLTWSSNSSNTSYAVVADLLEMDLKKILIEKMEGNKSIHRSNEQRNLYKALVEAYESDKIILDTYGNTVTLKSRDDDADKDEEPSAGSDRGSKRRRKGKELESVSAPKEKATRSAGKSTQVSKSRQTSVSESATAEEPMQTTLEKEELSHPEFETGADGQPIEEPSQHPEWFSQQNKPPTPDRDWNKTLPATHGSIQPWISKLAKQTDFCSSRSSFN
nr:hypothetical protein [Tanacetum cinerariifolium]